MKLLLSRRFLNDTEGLPNDVQERVREALAKIHMNPFCGKRLRGGMSGYFSLRIGSYRIIYSLNLEEEISIKTVRPRKDVYRR